jgi:hypothetical protein
MSPIHAGKGPKLEMRLGSWTRVIFDYNDVPEHHLSRIMGGGDLLAHLIEIM